MTATKIKYIPTELNYINYTNNRLKNHNKRINYTTRLILFLILWCMTLTGFLIHNSIQTNQTILNNTIMNEELIPQYTLDEFEVIGD